MKIFEPDRMSHYLVGPTVIGLVFGVVKWFDTGSMRLNLSDAVWLVLVVVIWLRWTAEREFNYLRTRVENMSDEINRLTTKPSEKPSE